MSGRIDDLVSLPMSERLQLVEDLWESIARELETSPIPDSICAEMDARRAAYLADPPHSSSLEEVQRRMKVGA